MRDVKFTELLSAIVDNRGRTCPTSDKGVPLIATNCVRNELLYPAFERVRFVDQTTYSTWFRAHPKPGDILFVCKGTPGRVCLVPDPVEFCIAQDMVAVRPDPKKVYPKFLFALLRTRDVQKRIANLHVGSLIPHFKKGDFDKLLLDMPDERTQRVVGDLYFDLSGKIDLNLRMNRTLEEMAQALFKSWFIDFDGHDDLVDSEIGPVPRGWGVRLVRDFILLDKGLSYKGDYLTEHGVPMVNLKCVLPNGGFRRDGVKPYSGEFKPRHQVRAGDIVVANTDLTQARDILGCPAIVPARYRGTPVITSHHTFALRLSSAELGTQFVYGLLLTERARTRCRGFATGTTVLAVPADAILDLDFALPPSGLLQEYEAAAGALRSRIEANHEESETLATLRDTLLPKLISGELGVPEAEATIAEAL